MRPSFAELKLLSLSFLPHQLKEFQELPVSGSIRNHFIILHFLGTRYYTTFLYIQCVLQLDSNSLLKSKLF